MDRNISIAKVVTSQYDGDHESQKLAINMVSKKNMHWSNTIKGKVPVIHHEHRDDQDKKDRKDKKKKSKRGGDDDKSTERQAAKHAAKKSDTDTPHGIAVNSSAFCQTAER